MSELLRRRSGEGGGGSGRDVARRRGAGPRRRVAESKSSSGHQQQPHEQQTSQAQPQEGARHRVAGRRRGTAGGGHKKAGGGSGKGKQDKEKEGGSEEAASGSGGGSEGVNTRAPSAKSRRKAAQRQAAQASRAVDGDDGSMPSAGGGRQRRALATDAAEARIANLASVPLVALPSVDDDVRPLSRPRSHPSAPSSVVVSVSLGGKKPTFKPRRVLVGRHGTVAWKLEGSRKKRGSQDGSTTVQVACTELMFQSTPLGGKTTKGSSLQFAESGTYDFFLSSSPKSMCSVTVVEPSQPDASTAASGGGKPKSRGAKQGRKSSQSPVPSTRTFVDLPIAEIPLGPLSPDGGPVPHISAQLRDFDGSLPALDEFVGSEELVEHPSVSSLSSNPSAIDEAVVEPAPAQARATAAAPTASNARCQVHVVRFRERGRSILEPRILTIQMGSTVRWLNDSSMDHKVESDSGTFSSSTLKPGDVFEFTFRRAGTFTYQCAVFGFLTGEITVTHDGSSRDRETVARVRVSHVQPRVLTHLRAAQQRGSPGQHGRSPPRDAVVKEVQASLGDTITTAIRGRGRESGSASDGHSSESEVDASRLRFHRHGTSPTAPGALPGDSDSSSFADDTDMDIDDEGGDGAAPQDESSSFASTTPSPGPPVQPRVRASHASGDERRARDKGRATQTEEQASAPLVPVSIAPLSDATKVSDTVSLATPTGAVAASDRNVSAGGGKAAVDGTPAGEDATQTKKKKKKRRKKKTTKAKALGKDAQLAGVADSEMKREGELEPRPSASQNEAKQAKAKVHPSQAAQPKAKQQPKSEFKQASKNESTQAPKTQPLLPADTKSHGIPTRGSTAMQPAAEATVAVAAAGLSSTRDDSESSGDVVQSPGPGTQSSAVEHAAPVAEERAHPSDSYDAGPHAVAGQISFGFFEEEESALPKNARKRGTSETTPTVVSFGFDDDDDSDDAVSGVAAGSSTAPVFTAVVPGTEPQLELAAAEPDRAPTQERDASPRSEVENYARRDSDPRVPPGLGDQSAAPSSPPTPLLQTAVHRSPIEKGQDIMRLLGQQAQILPQPQAHAHPAVQVHDELPGELGDASPEAPQPDPRASVSVEGGVDLGLASAMLMSRLLRAQHLAYSQGGQMFQHDRVVGPFFGGWDVVADEALVQQHALPGRPGS